MDIKKKYEASCIYSGEGKRLSGHRAFNPDGHLVKLRPGALGLVATVESGLSITGLKPGRKLATKADEDELKKSQAAKPKAKTK